MNEFKNIDEVISYIESLINRDNEDIIDIEEYHKIFKFSAEKLARRFNLDEAKLVTDFNQYKKQIYKKIIIYEKVKKLKKINPENIYFNYANETYKTRNCVCIEFFESKYKHHTFLFYPQVKYLYVELEKTIVLFPDNQNHIRLYATKKEFNKHFVDIREYKINQIIN